MCSVATRMATTAWPARALSLAEGFRDDNWISSIAAPALSELLQERWYGRRT